MISCRENGPNRKSSIGRDTATKKQEQGFNFEFEIWLMNSTKKKKKWVYENYSTIFLPKFETQKMVSKVRGKLTQRLLERCLLGVTTDSRRDWWTRLESTQTAELLFVVKSTLAKLAVCGYLHRKIGGSKKFKCPGCHQESDRHFNAARNILLKNMILGFRD
jgi:putative transposase